MLQDKNKDEIQKNPVCSVCGSKDIRTLIDLQTTPIAGEFLGQAKEREKYPLKVQICENCCHAELETKLEPELLYGSSFSYVSSSSPGLEQYFEYIIKLASIKLNIDSLKSWLDIGSNDGLLLDIAHKNGFKTYGIEPSATQAEQSKKKRIHNIENDYATDDAFEKLGEDSYKIISILNTLSNCINPMPILAKAKEFLAEDGIIFISTGELDAICDGNIDYIYHEHNHYFSTSSIKAAADQLSLEVIHLERTKQKGGSILVGLTNCDKKINEEAAICDEDKYKSGEDYIDAISKSIKKMEAIKTELKNQLKKWKGENRLIACFGASQSTSTLVHLLEVGEHVNCYVDDNAQKLLTFSPEYNKPVISTEMLLSEASKGNLIGIVPGGWRFAEQWSTRHDLDSIKEIDIFEMYLNPRE